MVFDYQVPINIKILCTKQFAAVTLLSAGVSMLHSHHGKDGFRLVRVFPAECMYLDHSVFVCLSYSHSHRFESKQYPRQCQRAAKSGVKYGDEYIWRKSGITQPDTAAHHDSHDQVCF